MRVKVVFWAVAVLGISSVVYSLESLSGNDIQALKYYQAHAYRHSVDILSVKTNLSVLEKYVLARSLQELKRDDDALELFRSMNLDEISKSKYGSFLLENTVYYFSRLLADKGGGTNGDQLDLSLKEIRPLMNALPIKSIYYPDLLKSLLALEWKKGDYQSITNIGYQASFVSNYQELALFALGDYGRLSNIAQTFPDAAIILLKDLTNNIDPQSITNISVSGLSRLFLFYLNQGQYGPASQFLEAAIEKNPDEDFAFRNRFLYEYRRGNRQAAMESFSRKDRKR